MAKPKKGSGHLLPVSESPRSRPRMLWPVNVALAATLHLLSGLSARVGGPPGL